MYRANVGIAKAYLWLSASYLQFRKNMNCSACATVRKFLSIENAFSGHAEFISAPH